MKIIGISSLYHDSAAALIVDGEIVAAAQEERFTRKKHDPSFPVNALKYCLTEGGISLSSLDALAFYDKPLLKFERLLETYYAFAPHGIKSFVNSMPVWIKEKMFLKRLIHRELAAIEPYDKKKLRLLFPEHHLSHAASAFYPSSFEDAAILTIDGVGEWATASIAHGQGNSIRILKEMQFPHSVGLLYSAFTYFLGFRVNSGEYKLMGLAPYGSRDAEEVKKFVRIIKEKLVDIKKDGSIWLDQSFFNYATDLTMVKEKKWEALFGFRKRKPGEALKVCHCHLAAAIQMVTEEIIVAMAIEAKRLTDSDNLCMAGGVALNCVANGILQNKDVFDNLFIQPAAGDAGGALGAAQAAHYIYFGNLRRTTQSTDSMKGAYLGPDLITAEIRTMAKKFGAVFSHFENEDELCEHVAGKISQGYIVGWVQGRMEFGPRALGNRSILADPRNRQMQRKLNLSIKYRESFRPFAPSVMEEDACKYFELKSPSPYMLLVQRVREQTLLPLPDNYQSLSIREKVYCHKSLLPAITHVDLSARIQTVRKETNPRYWHLLSEMKAITGAGMVVNTSFNVRGEPIVCTPEDAYRCFMRTEMDLLVVGDHVFEKSAQLPVAVNHEWTREFVLD